MDANGIMKRKEARERGEWLSRSMDYEDGINHANLKNIQSRLENKLDKNLISKITGKPYKK